MTKRDKREEKIRRNPSNVSLDEFERLANDYGYIEPGGKHFKAHVGRYTMTYKRENPVKPEYVKQLLKYIDLL